MKSLISLVLLFFYSFNSHALMIEDFLSDNESILAQEELKKVSGRIIQVISNQDQMTIINICSATLVDEDIIVSAGHCFKRNYFLTKTDALKKIARDLTSRELYYFDIPGITSKELEEKIYPLTDNTGMVVPKENKEKLKAILKTIPLIKSVQFLEEYERNTPVLLNKYQAKTERQKKILENKIQNYNWDYSWNIYDLSIGKLNTKLKRPDISIGDFDSDSGIIYVSGFSGGSFYEPLSVFKCDSSKNAINGLLPKAEFKSFLTLVGYSNRLIISSCNGEIIEGQSGGPQVQLRDGKLVLVGVNSGLLYQTTNNIVSPRASIIKDKVVF